MDKLIANDTRYGCSRLNLRTYLGWVQLADDDNDRRG